MAGEHAAPTTGDDPVADGEPLNIIANCFDYPGAFAAGYLWDRWLDLIAASGCQDIDKADTCRLDCHAHFICRGRAGIDIDKVIILGRPQYIGYHRTHRYSGLGYRHRKNLVTIILEV